MAEQSPPRAGLKHVRLLLWAVVALGAAGMAVLLFVRSQPANRDPSVTHSRSSFGGPFTLVGSDGEPFSSARLSGKPYAIYFGFTRCGDVCPTTLARMAKLRNEIGDAGEFNIVFVTIDPSNDGPREVGQYAGLFNSPIIGLTGSQSQIDRVKREFGIYAQPSAHPMAGKEMEHSAAVLLFDRHGDFVATIAPDDPDADAIAKLKRMVG